MTCTPSTVSRRISTDFICSTTWNYASQIAAVILEKKSNSVKSGYDTVAKNTSHHTKKMVKQRNLTQ